MNLQCAKIIVGFMANVGNVFIKSLQTFFHVFTFFDVFLNFYLSVYYIYDIYERRYGCDVTQ